MRVISLFFPIFGSFFLLSFHQIAQQYQEFTIQTIEEEGDLSSLIQQRIAEIQSLHETLHPFLEKKKLQNQNFLHDFWSIFSIGDLVLISEGSAGAYKLYNLKKVPCFIIKPTDECVFCLNNPKRYNSAFAGPRYQMKNHIPLYRSAQTEAFCYELASIYKLEHVIPRTILAFLSHPKFFYPFHQGNNTQFPEKLCSIQEYLKDTFSLRKVLEELFRCHLSEKEIEKHFDQEDFEDLILFLWLISDTDAHVENFRVYLKNVSMEGHPIYGLKKIDNSLSFPELNLGVSNALMYFPNALLPVSDRTRLHVQSLSILKIQEVMYSFHLESAYEAFEERILLLQKIVEKKNITYYECSLRLALLGTSEGKELAAKNCSLKFLEYATRNLPKPHRVFFAEQN